MTSSEDVGVYRAPMRSRYRDVPEGAAVDRALSHGLCGMGGVLGTQPGDLDEALDAARSQHDDRLARRIGRFAQVADGAYVWTRDVDGMYWLGRLAGPWLYDATPAAVAVDLVHVRPCHWLTSPVEDARVPAGVLDTFARGGKNWQQTHRPDALEASARLWREARVG